MAIDLTGFKKGEKKDKGEKVTRHYVVLDEDLYEVLNSKDIKMTPAVNAIVREELIKQKML